MRAPHELVSSRARLRPRYALFPLEGYPLSRLPAWPGIAARVLASPALGAAFVETLLDLESGQSGGHPADDRTETFVFVVEGTANLVIDLSSPGGRRDALTAGGYALVPAASGFTLTATTACRVLLLRKTYEPLAGTPLPPPLVGNERDVADTAYLGDAGALLKTLVPDELPYDLAMNIFTFAPGHGLPVVETHVMEHGLFVLQGRGLYYLDDTWMEVDADDFIWMGPYVPQSFVAAGPVPARYIYYKNVNRDVPPAA
jgi:(S)-ureidoglycine aminohydrolase